MPPSNSMTVLYAPEEDAWYWMAPDNRRIGPIKHSLLGATLKEQIAPRTKSLPGWSKPLAPSVKASEKLKADMDRWEIANGKVRRIGATPAARREIANAELDEILEGLLP